MHTTIIKADQLLSTSTLETLDQMPCLKRESCSSRSDPRRLRQSDWQQFWHEFCCLSVGLSLCLPVCCFTCNITESEALRSGGRGLGTIKVENLQLYPIVCK